jgi:hypothetical protein
MGILALQGIEGCEEKDVQKFINYLESDGKSKYRALYSDLKLKDKKIVLADNWQHFIGDASKALEFRRVFREILKKDGDINTSLKNIMPHFVSGLPMGLFHPIIRLSFALLHDKNDADLIADSLTYFAIRYE